MVLFSIHFPLNGKIGLLQFYFPVFITHNTLNHLILPKNFSCFSDLYCLKFPVLTPNSCLIQFSSISSFLLLSSWQLPPTAAASVITSGLWIHFLINIFHPEGFPNFQSCLFNEFDIYDLSALQTQHDENKSPHISYFQNPGHLPTITRLFYCLYQNFQCLFVYCGINL